MLVSEDVFWSVVYYRSGIFVHVKRNLNLLYKYSCKSTVTNFSKIGPVGGTLVHMDSYNEFNRRFLESGVGQLKVL